MQSITGHRRGVLAALFVITGAGLATSCSSEPLQEDSGSISLAMEVGGLTLTSISYAISSPAGLLKKGDIDLTNSNTLSAVIGGIPAGVGYTITLYGSAAGNASLICEGFAVFDVAAGITTSTSVHLTCTVPPKNGSVMINGSVNVCPTIDDLSVLPASALVGHAVTLSASASDLDAAPVSALTYRWTVNGGTLSDPSHPGTSLTCTSRGLITVTLLVSDGDPACDQTSTQVVACTSAEAASTDDASTPGDDRAGYITCWTPNDDGTFAVCGPGLRCCLGSTPRCDPTCGGGLGTQGCDGPEDCAAGLQCLEFKGSFCAAAATPMDQYLCHRDSDCPDATTCSSSGYCT